MADYSVKPTENWIMDLPRVFQERDSRLPGVHVDDD